VRSQKASTNCQDGVANRDGDRVKKYTPLHAEMQVRAGTSMPTAAQSPTCRHFITQWNNLASLGEDVRSAGPRRSNKCCATVYPSSASFMALFTWTRADVNKHFIFRRQY